MPQIRDPDGQVWIVCERFVDIATRRERATAVQRDEFTYATLTFITPDGRAKRVLSDIAPRNWRACGDEYLSEWLVLARPAPLNGD